MFSDLGESLLGKTSQEIGDLLEYNKDEGEKIFSKITFQSYVFKLRIKQDFYGVRF